MTYQFADKYALARTNADTLDGGGLVRMARCRLPATPKVIKAVKGQLSKFKQASWAHNHTSQKQVRGSKANPDPVVSGWEYGCTKIIKWYLCPEGETENPEDNPECTFLYSECYEYGLKYVEEEEPPGGGGGSSDNGDPCEPCTQEPGGPVMPCESQPGGNDGVPQGCAVEQDIEITEPCDTGNPALDDLNTQTKMNQLWEDSDIDKPIEERQEQGGFITKNSNGEYGFESFPSNWGYFACGISHPSDWKSVIPSNTVGVLHTHPFLLGDNTKSVCGEDGTENYTSGTNAWDLDFIADIQNYLSDYSIKGYILDGGNIVTFSPLPGVYNENNRCGY